MNLMKLFLLLVTLVALEPTRVFGFAPIGCVVSDNTNGTLDPRFGHEIGALYTGKTMLDAMDFILKTFNQVNGGGKNYASINADIESFAATRRYPAIANIINNLIVLNADYVQAYSGDVKAEFTGILYHVSARVLQWTANGEAPGGLITGVADYIRLAAGWPSRDWVPKGSGFRWDEGFEVTAYFLEYCNELKGGFIADLNAMMRYSYNDAYFVQLLGKSVYELWDEYKQAYGGKLQAFAPAPGSGY